ncbi:MAG: hypothetical protein ABSF29_02230 [Tepidisphaeraceae bacterium]
MLPGLAWGCNSSSVTERPDGSGPQYVLSSPSGLAKPRELHPGDTVAIVLARDLANSGLGGVTLVLIRHGPEGKTRELIQLDAAGKLMDEKQNYVLRDGDEMILPGEQSNPSDYNRPDLPAARGGP